jgi:hypothetical protein
LSTIAIESRDYARMSHDHVHHAVRRMSMCTIASNSADVSRERRSILLKQAARVTSTDE